MFRLLVIIPAYNEEENIGKLLKSFRSVNVLDNIELDIVVINDCSKDQTSAVCRYHGVSVIDLPSNLGIGGAVQTGYKYALRNNYDFAVQIDGDGQHPPECLGEIIKPILRNESDLVIGSRYLTKEGFQSTFARQIGIKFFSKLIKVISGQVVTDPTSGYRACNKRVIKMFAESYPKDYPEPETIVALRRNNFKVMEIPVVMRERENGHSSINFSKSIYYMIKVSMAIIIDKLRSPARKVNEGEKSYDFV